MQALFVLTIFLGATLLFCVQPMIAKAILPLLGGAPQVWITCMLFFQAALLGGYAYAHAVSERLGPRRQAALHAALALLPLVVVGQGASIGTPIALPLSASLAEAAAPWQQRYPGLRVLLLLASTVGLPFFVLSTTSPLLQRWFSRTAHANAHDPYYLYGASNLGSLLSLLAYPLLLEPSLGLARQSRLWGIGYAIFAVLIAACAARAWGGPRPETAALRRSASDAPDEAAPTPLRRLRWIALAFVPSVHLLGVTTYLTTDIAPVPLLWVVPLALYLVTFVLAFAKKPPLRHAWMVRALPLGAMATVLLLLAEAAGPLPLILAVHLTTFFLAAMVCHGELAADRPSRRHLTSFYMFLSLGGALGGVFNGILAPLLFDHLAEYPIAIVLACLCRRVAPAAGEVDPVALRRRRTMDLAIPAATAVVTTALVLGFRALGRAPDQLSIGVVFGLPALAIYGSLQYPIRFGLSVGALLVAGTVYTGVHGVDLDRERTFFGALRVTRDLNGFHRLVHGSTVHGMQRMSDAGRPEPLSYFTRTGPIGRVFEERRRAGLSPSTVGVVGLGVGALASYAEPGQRWTFFEINPAIERIARDPRFFTFLRDASPSGEGGTVLIGDARLRMRELPSSSFDLLVLDAFSSDAIPAHLVTRQAFSIYLDKLAPRGVIAFHISNNFLDLQPVLGNLAQDAGLAARVLVDSVLTKAQERAGKSASIWVVMARGEGDLGELVKLAGAAPLPSRPDLGVWTDDYSNLLQIVKW